MHTTLYADLCFIGDISVERPNLGCRVLMFRNMSKIMPAIMRDVQDWVVDTRKKSSGLLYYMLLNGEEYITQHMELITTGMFRACADEEKEVVANVRSLFPFANLCYLILTGSLLQCSKCGLIKKVWGTEALLGIVNKNLFIFIFIFAFFSQK